MYLPTSAAKMLKVNFKIKCSGKCLQRNESLCSETQRCLSLSTRTNWWHVPDKTKWLLALDNALITRRKPDVHGRLDEQWKIQTSWRIHSNLPNLIDFLMGVCLLQKTMFALMPLYREGSNGSATIKTNIIMGAGVTTWILFFISA